MFWQISKLLWQINTFLYNSLVPYYSELFITYVATFQQHLSWYDIPELVGPIRISLIKVAINKEAAEPMVPSGYVEVITSQVLLSQSCNDKNVDIKFMCTTRID